MNTTAVTTAVTITTAAPAGKTAERRSLRKALLAATTSTKRCWPHPVSTQFRAAAITE